MHWQEREIETDWRDTSEGRVRTYLERVYRNCPGEAARLMAETEADPEHNQPATLSRYFRLVK
ncbi:MAG: hypothetical protein V2A58_11285 [Planctomycetota bacterium]